jgi:hypothetical protein
MAEPLFDLLFDDFANTDRRVANQKHYPPVRQREPQSFDPEVADVARDAAIEQVEANADPDWKEAFYQAVETVAGRMEEFTADEVWEHLSTVPNVPKQHEPRAAGAVIVRAMKNGVIRAKPNFFQKSRRRSCHSSPIQVYESRIYGEVNG